MVKQLRYLLTLLLVMVASVTWAEEVVYKTALFGKDYNSQSVSSYTSTWTSTNAGFTVSLANFNNNSNGWTYVKCGKKNNASVATIITSAAIDKAITKVAVTIGAITATDVNSIKLYTSTNNSDWTEAGSFTTSEGAQTVSLSGPTENLYYKIEFDCASASSNGTVTVSKVEYYCEGEADTSVATTTTINVPTDFNTDLYVSTAAGQLTATVAGEDGSPVDGATVTWESSEPGVATIDGNGNVTLVAKGSTTITATYAGVENEYKASEATYEITVTSSEPYVQPTTVEINMNYKWLGSSSGANLSKDQLPVVKNDDNVTTTITDGTSTRPRGDSDYIRLYTGSTLTFDAPEGYIITSIVFTKGGSGTWNGPMVSAGTLSELNWTGSSESVIFTLSGSCFISKATITLKQKSDKKEAEVKISETNLLVGATATVTTDGPAVTLATDNAAVASVDGATVTGVALGKATITATWAENDEYQGGSVTFEVYVTEGAGTEDNPYTVADANFILAANSSVNGVYVKGIISQIDEVSTQYKNAQYWISDDGTTTGQLEIYRGKYLNGADFTSEDQIQTGDKVVVYGNLTVFKGTNEFAADSKIISLEREGAKKFAELSFSASSYTAKIGEENSFPALNNPNALVVTYESSNTDVATISADGVVTLVAVGETTITAKSEETDDYAAGEASYKLTVKQPKALVTVDEDGNTTFDFTDNEWGFPEGSGNKTVAEGEFSNVGYTIKVAGNTGNGYYFNTSDKYLMLGKSGAYLTLPAFDFDVEKIEVTGRTGASGKTGQNIYVGDVAVSTQTTGARSTNTYEIAADYQAAGNIYTLKVTNDNNTQIVEIKVYKKPEPEYVTVTISEAAKGKNKIGVERYFGTLYYSNKNLKMSGTNLGAHPVKIVDGKIDEISTYSSNRGDVIPAGVAVLLEAVNPGDYTFEVVAEAPITAPSGNMLRGTDEDETITGDGYKYYMLSMDKNHENLGFYFDKDSNGGTQLKNKAHKAYLAVRTDDASAKGYAFGGDETTGVEGIENGELRIENGELNIENAEVYDLQGRRMNGKNLPKGVYIVNGKKVVK